jgi:ABC-type amino acid transport substrate-binding protein
MWPEYHGLTWRNPRNGEVEGLDAEMARLLAARLRARLAFVEVAPGAGIVAAVEAGQCDIGMSGVTVTEERAERVAFTKPYLSTPLVGIVNRASTRVRQWSDIDRPGIVVAVSDGVPAEGVMRGALRRAELAVLSPPRRRESEVQAGRVDVFITDVPYGRGLAMQQDWMRLVEAPARFGETLMAYVLPRGDAPWLAEANSFLAAVKGDGALARVAERYGILGLVAY